MDAISGLFVFSALVLILTPGQDMILVMSRSLSQGVQAGVLTAFGLCLGLVGHILLAMFGVGAVLVAFPWVLHFIKLVGALYLFYLGYQFWASSQNELGINQLEKQSYTSILAQGFIANITNPKIILFFLSFLPQFVTDTGNQQRQILALGLCFVALAFGIKSTAGILAGASTLWIKKHPHFLQYCYKISGVIIFVLALALLLEEAKELLLI